MGTAINLFWNINSCIFFKNKMSKTPAGESESLALLNEYFENLNLADRCSSLAEERTSSETK